jgi:hypothetical protein
MVRYHGLTGSGQPKLNKDVEITIYLRCPNGHVKPYKVMKGYYGTKERNKRLKIALFSSLVAGLFLILALTSLALFPKRIATSVSATLKDRTIIIDGTLPKNAIAEIEIDSLIIADSQNMAPNTVRQYLRLVKDFHPTLKVALPERQRAVKLKTGQRLRFRCDSHQSCGQRSLKDDPRIPDCSKSLYTVSA